MSLNFNGNNIGGAPSGGGGTPYILPIASEDTLGGVKIDGKTITITNEGVISSQGGGSVTVDSELSSSSTNPVQNKVINSALNDKQNVIDASNKLSANYVSGLASVATSGDYADLINGYSLPTASTSTLGGVKVDGSTITINDGVISSQGGGGTSDHAQLTNLDYANSGHTGFLSSENYLPHGTIITVGADKDFQSIQDAYNSIEGKWSDGTVTIKIDDGTYNELLEFKGRYNIPNLIIAGTSKAGTIIKPNFTSDWQAGWSFANQKNITIQDLTVQGTASKYETGIMAQRFSEITVANILIKNVQYSGLRSVAGSKVFLLSQGITIENTSTKGQNGLMSNGGGMITGGWGVNVNITNFSTGIRAEYTGTNTFESISYTNSSVTTPWSPALNSTAAANAWNTNKV